MEIFLRDKGVQNSVRLGRQGEHYGSVPRRWSRRSATCDKESWDCDSLHRTRTSGVSKSGRVNAPGGAAVLGLPCPAPMRETGFNITCSPIPRGLEDDFVPKARGRISILDVVRLGFVPDRA